MSPNSHWTLLQTSQCLLAAFAGQLDPVSLAAEGMLFELPSMEHFSQCGAGFDPPVACFTPYPTSMNPLVLP